MDDGRVKWLCVTCLVLTMLALGTAVVGPIYLLQQGAQMRSIQYAVAEKQAELNDLTKDLLMYADMDRRIVPLLMAHKDFLGLKVGRPEDAADKTEGSVEGQPREADGAD